MLGNGQQRAGVGGAFNRRVRVDVHSGLVRNRLRHSNERNSRVLGRQSSQSAQFAAEHQSASDCGGRDSHLRCVRGGGFDHLLGIEFVW